MRDGADLPYYAGEPVDISPAGWLIVMASVVLAFLLLLALPLPTPPLNFIPAIVFTGLPLFALMAVSGWTPPAIFGPITGRGIAMGLGAGLVTIVVSFMVGPIVSMLFGVAANPAAISLATMGTLDLVLFLARTFIQLIGEEVVSILPLLGVLWLCTRKCGLSRRTGLIAAVVVSTLWFAAMHLPTYDWNVAQCVLIIGSARLVLTMTYLLTRNLWVSSIAHIANDWTLFLTAYGLGHLPVGTG